jgi:sulfoxide reductase heme-binding subunit YedZ
MVMVKKYLVFTKEWIFKNTINILIYSPLFFKKIVFLLCLWPIISMCFTFFTNNFGANPVNEIIHHFGKWTLIFVCLTLSISPLRRITKSNSWLLYRKMLGLFVFFYASIHLLSYTGLDHHFDWNIILKDILEHRYVLVGTAAWILLLPLALTSSQKMKKILKQNWIKLHRLVYVIAILGVLHYLWLVKKDLTQPMIYATIVTILLLLRIKFKKKVNRNGN